MPLKGKQEAVTHSNSSSTPSLGGKGVTRCVTASVNRMFSSRLSLCNKAHSNQCRKSATVSISRHWVLVGAATHCDKLACFQSKVTRNIIHNEWRTRERGLNHETTEENRVSHAERVSQGKSTKSEGIANVVWSLVRHECSSCIARICGDSIALNGQNLFQDDLINTKKFRCWHFLNVKLVSVVWLLKKWTLLGSGPNHNTYTASLYVKWLLNLSDHIIVVLLWHLRAHTHTHRHIYVLMFSMAFGNEQLVCIRLWMLGWWRLTYKSNQMRLCF